MAKRKMLYSDSMENIVESHLRGNQNWEKKEITIDYCYPPPLPLQCTTRYKVPWHDPVPHTKAQTAHAYLRLWTITGQRPVPPRTATCTLRLLVAGIETFKMRVPLQQQMLQFHVTLFQIIVDQYFVKISGPCPVFNFSDGVF